MPERTLAVLMTCFNRRASTLACLGRLGEQALPEDVRVQVYLTDDGSTDGTADAVREAFPEVHLMSGDGNLYWSGGMRLAWRAALAQGHDFYLWLNDDTLLYPDALARLLDTHAQLGSLAPLIVVGSTQDPLTQHTTYGGVTRSSRLHPARFARVLPGHEPRPCQTMNGNCVLICRQVAERIGNLSEAFTHGMADYDYGLRAAQAGCSIWVAPGHVGTCANDHPRQSWRDPTVPRRHRWRQVTSTKGLPPREWGLFLKRHGGPLWPLYWLVPYARIWLGR